VKHLKGLHNESQRLWSESGTPKLIFKSLPSVKMPQTTFYHSTRVMFRNESESDASKSRQSKLEADVQCFTSEIPAL
jgi:hypothetical protein